MVKAGLQEHGMSISFHHLEGWVNVQQAFPFPPQAPFKWSGQAEAHQILCAVHGQCLPGELLAFMGPSGSSKTTLLSVLGGRCSRGLKVCGQIWYNERHICKAIKKSIGYVLQGGLRLSMLQDDLLHSSLTAYETLYYTALLKLPRSLTMENKVARVEDMVKVMGLERCQHTIVSGGLLQAYFSGISGGERRRLSVAIELISDPSALLLDEPTSGLDSTNAMRLFNMLRKLAREGQSVILTLHQPGSRIFQQLDKLLVLSEGHSLYYGRADSADLWLTTLGFSIPAGIHSADFILDLAAGSLAAESLSDEQYCQYCQFCLACARAFANESGCKAFDSTLVPLVEGIAAALAQQEHHSADLPPRPATTPGPAKGVRGQPVIADVESGLAPGSGKQARHSGNDAEQGPTWLQQYRLLFRKSLLTRRFEIISHHDIGFVLFIALLTGFFWLHCGDTDTVYGLYNVSSMLFFLMMFASAKAMFQALFVFPPEFQMILKERAVGTYRLSAYYCARLSSDLPIDCILPVILVTIVYFMGSLEQSASTFFATLASIILFVLTAQSFGLFVGAVCPAPKTALILTSAVNLSMMLVAGFFVRDIPVGLAWLKYLSFVFYGYSLLQKIHFRDKRVALCGLERVRMQKDAHVQRRCRVVSPEDLQEALSMTHNPDGPPWEAAALIGMLIIMRIAIYVGLRLKTCSSVDTRR